MKRYAKDYDPSTLVVPLCELTEARRQRDLLLKAISEMVVDVGIYTSDGLSGPMALMALEDVTSYVKLLHKKIEEIPD